LASEAGHASTIEYLMDTNIEFKFNNQKQSFIDLAIKNKRDNALFTIIANKRWEEVFSLTSFEYKTPLMGIIQISSDITRALLDRCVVRISVDKSELKTDKLLYSDKVIFSPHFFL
jgi:hypothetical protein